jgi:hypothetical protein
LDKSADLPERAKKEPNFETVNYLYFSLLECTWKTGLITGVGTEIVEKIVPF